MLRSDINEDVKAKMDKDVAVEHLGFNPEPPLSESTSVMYAKDVCTMSLMCDYSGQTRDQMLGLFRKSEEIASCIRNFVCTYILLLF